MESVNIVMKKIIGVKHHLINSTIYAIHAKKGFFCHEKLYAQKAKAEK